MKSAQEYLLDFRRILGIAPEASEVNLHFASDTLQEARISIKEISQRQKELRLLRKEVTATIKEIKASFSAAKSQVQAGFWASVGGKQSAARDREYKRQSLRKQQDAQLRGYEAVIQNIDRVLVQLDGTKIQVEKELLSKAQ